MLLKLIKYWVKKTKKSKKKLDYKNVLFWTTPYSFIYVLMIFAMLIGAINYNNSLVFSLTFLLFNMGIISLLYTHNNLSGLLIEVRKADNVFLSDHVTVPVYVKNNTKYQKYSVALNWENEKENSMTFDLEPFEEKTIHLSYKPNSRGYCQLPHIELFSTFPMNLSRSWTLLFPFNNPVIYPKPEKNDYDLLYDDDSFSEQNQQQITKGNENFSHLREYYTGDPINLIDWKSFARYNKPMIKEFTFNQNSNIWLNWHNLPNNFSVETKLSILSYYIVWAQRNEIEYGLKLPNSIVDAGKSETHFEECLTKLALF